MAFIISDHSFIILLEYYKILHPTLSKAAFCEVQLTVRDLEAFND